MGLTSWAYSPDADLYLLQSQDRPPPLWWPEEFRTGQGQWGVNSLQAGWPLEESLGYQRQTMDVSLMKESRDCMVIQNGKHPGKAQMNPTIRKNEVHGPWVEGDNSSLGSLIYWRLHCWEVSNSRSKHVLYTFLKWLKNNYNKIEHLLSTIFVPGMVLSALPYINLLNPHDDLISLVDWPLWLMICKDGPDNPSHPCMCVPHLPSRGAVDFLSLSIWAGLVTHFVQ